MKFCEYAHHHFATVFLFWCCVGASLLLISYLWLKHQRDPLPKRILWSLILCVPFFGCLLYGIFYTPLTEKDVRARHDNDTFDEGH